MTDFILGILVAIWISIVALFLIEALISKPDPPPKLCTIKLNDANNQTSYVTGECVQ